MAEITDRRIVPSFQAPSRGGEAAGVHFGRLSLVLIVGLVIWLLPPPEGVKPQAWHLLAIFVATVLGILQP
jgi:hypothetical protein